MCSRLASRQKGVVSREQLLAAGLTPGVIRGLIAGDLLHPLHRGVYAVGHLALPKYAREQAALLACGAGAIISGRSALFLWGILESPPGVVDLIVVQHCGPRPGMRVHRTKPVDHRDIRSRHGLPLTSPARAVIEFAVDATQRELEEAVAQARSGRLLRDGELEKVLERVGQMRGAARMRAFLKEEDGPGITRSHAERRFRKLLRAAQLPQPTTSAWIAGQEADFMWAAEKVILEVDGYQFHGHRTAFESDRRKDMIWRDAGYTVIRITWRQFTQQPLALVAHVARILDRRSRPAD